MRKVEHETGIYAIRNKVNNKAYIGQSLDIHERWMEHKWRLNNGIYSNIALLNDWRQHSEESFECITLLNCDPELLRDYEAMFIGLYNTTDPCFGYNYVGRKGFAQSNIELTKAKSEALKNHYKNNPEKAQQRFDAVRAALRTPEYRQRKREDAVKMFQDAEYRRKYHETRDIEEYRKRISEAHKGQKMTPEAKEKMIKALSKQIMCIETGVIYSSAKEANRSLPGNVNVQAAALGYRKTAGGYHWKYVNLHDATKDDNL